MLLLYLKLLYVFLVKILNGERQKPTLNLFLKFGVCSMLVHAITHLAKDSSYTTSQKSRKKLYSPVNSQNYPRPGTGTETVERPPVTPVFKGITWRCR